MAEKEFNWNEFLFQEMLGASAITLELLGYFPTDLGVEGYVSFLMLLEKKFRFVDWVFSLFLQTADLMITKKDISEKDLEKIIFSLKAKTEGLRVSNTGEDKRVKLVKDRFPKYFSWKYFCRAGGSINLSHYKIFANPRFFLNEFWLDFKDLLHFYGSFVEYLFHRYLESHKKDLPINIDLFSPVRERFKTIEDVQRSVGGKFTRGMLSFMLIPLSLWAPLDDLEFVLRDVYGERLNMHNAGQIRAEPLLWYFWHLLNYRKGKTSTHPVKYIFTASANDWIIRNLFQLSQKGIVFKQAVNNFTRATGYNPFTGINPDYLLSLGLLYRGSMSGRAEKLNPLLLTFLNLYIDAMALQEYLRFKGMLESMRKRHTRQDAKSAQNLSDELLRDDKPQIARKMLSRIRVILTEDLIGKDVVADQLKYLLPALGSTAAKVKQVVGGVKGVLTGRIYSVSKEANLISREIINYRKNPSFIRSVIEEESREISELLDLHSASFTMPSVVAVEQEEFQLDNYLAFMQIGDFASSEGVKYEDIRSYLDSRKGI